MPRHNTTVCSFKFVLLCCTVFFLFSLFSCKSVQEFESVEPLNLIDSNAPLIVYIPATENRKVVEYFLKEFAQLSQKNIQTVSSRTKNIAVSSDFLGNYQIASEGTYPKLGMNLALTEKNGWKSKKSDNTNFPFLIYSSSENQIELSSPDSSTVLISQKVEPMLQRYESAQSVLQDSSAEKKEEMSVKVYEYLTDSSASEIRFYAQNSSLFFNKVVGKVLNLGIKDVYGSLASSAKAKEKFALTLNLELSNEAVTKAAVKLLKVALFPIPAKIVQTGKETIKITELSLSYSQLLNFIKK